MRSRAHHRCDRGARGCAAADVGRGQFVRRQRHRRTGFQADRAGALSGQCGRLRCLSHGARTAASRLPAGVQSKRRSAMSPRRTSRLIARPASAPGAMRISTTPCAKAYGPMARGSILRCRTRPTPRCRMTTCWRSAPISRQSRRCAIRWSPIRCRSRSISAPRCASGIGSISHRANTSPIRKQSAEWNRGAFLVQGPGHCAACHTPKSFLGGDKREPISSRLTDPGLVRARHHQRQPHRARALVAAGCHRLSEDRP